MSSVDRSAGHARIALIPAALIAAFSVTPALGQSRVGPELHVSSSTVDNQWFPDVAVSESGRFVVVWPDASLRAVRGQIYGQRGQAIGGELQIYAATHSSDGTAAVAMDSRARFVVANLDGNAVYATLFSANGQPHGPAVQANTISMARSGYQGPDVAMAQDGGHVLVWSTLEPRAIYRNDIAGRRFAADGTPIGQEFRINSTTTGNRSEPAIAMTRDGSFMVTWIGQDPVESGDTALLGQPFDADGARIGDELRLASFRPFGRLPTAIAAGAGEYVVVWGASARRFDVRGAPLGEQISLEPGLLSTHAAVAMADDRSFVVAFWSGAFAATGESLREVFASRYDTFDSTDGVFVVNSHSQGEQFQPAIAMDGEGDFVVTWASRFQDDSGYGIYAQRYRRAGDRDPPVMSFETDSLTVTEGGSVTLMARLSKPAHQRILVPYELTTGYAAPADYSRADVAPAFAPGETITRLTRISATDDGDVEDAEPSNFALRPPHDGTAKMGTPRTTVVTIEDND